MKKGDIVRRQTISGDLIGPYMRVINARGGIISLAEENLHVFDRLILTQWSVFYKVLHIVKVKLNSEIIERVLSGKTDSIIHDYSVIWSRMLDDPDIIQIRDTRYENKVYLFTIEKADLLYIGRKKYIRVYLGRQLDLPK
jgi:hypothetical protein